MSYIYARAYGKSVNDDSYEVRIISTAAGSDTTKEFALDPVGFTLKYESENDQLLVPGIVHSRCEINTIWNDFTTLDSLITALGASQDGDFLIDIIRDSVSIWVGNILVEEFSVSENSATREVRLVATDGIGLLRNVDYNNAGTAYTGYQTVKDILLNIQEKWVLWDYMNGQYSGTTKRVVVADDVYSTDDWIMALLPHPAGSQYDTLSRSRIHTNPWSRVNDVGDTEYINCYDLLTSLCLTYQFRLYSYGAGWFFLPCALSDQTPTGYGYPYSGGASGAVTPIDTWSYQIAGSDTRQKGAEWLRTFTPQTKEISLTRDPNQGAVVLGVINVANEDELTAADIVYAGIDTESNDVRYVFEGQITVDNSAITIDENDDLGRLQLRFIIEWNPDSTAEYYVNTLASLYDGQIAVAQWLDGANVNYAPMFTYNPQYSASSGYYSLGQTEDNFYTPSTAGSRVIGFSFAVPPPQTAKTGLKVTPKVQAYNPQAQASATLQAALTISVKYLTVTKWSGDELELIDSFDWTARSTVGQNKQHLGTTYVGGLGASMGRIEVQTSAGVYGTSDNWVTQRDNTERPINKKCVEEVLAGHTQARQLERGSIVFRGTATPPKPFSRFYDNDTGNYYSAINWQLQATPGEVDVTLRKIGRNAIGITTEATNTGKIPDVPSTDTQQGAVKPQPPLMYSYNDRARTYFDGDWSAVIGGSETKEMYYTVANDGQGRYIDSQGDSPAAGYAIVRKIYVNVQGLQTRTSSGWTSPAALATQNNDTIADCIELMQQYMSYEKDHGAYTFMVTYSEVSTTPLLDTYTGAIGAYSLRKLRTGESSAIVVRRSSDSTTASIGFTVDGDLDEAGLLAFVGSGDGFISTWYDQSGNNNDMVMTSTASQPKIVSSGTVLTANGKPAAQFDGSNDSVLDVYNPNPNDHLTLASVVQWDVVNIGQYHFNCWSTAGASAQIFQMSMQSNGIARVAARYTNNALPRCDSASALSIDTQYIITAHFANNAAVAYYNGTQANDGTGASINGVDPNSFSGVVRIGARANDAALPLNGYVQEAIVWSQSGSGHSASDISTDMNSYYGAY